MIKTKIHIQYNEDIRSNDILEMIADTTLVTKSFDWEPQIDIVEGLKLTLENVL